MAVFDAPITTVVNGQDISRHLRSLDWSISQNFGRQGVTAHLVWTDDFGTSRASLANPASGNMVMPATTAGTPTFSIQPLHTVVMKDMNTDMGGPYTLFSGVITTPKLVTYGPTWNEWQCDAIDCTTYADNILVQGTWLGNTADFIVKQLIALANAQFGATVFTTVNVKPGPVINKYRANYVPLSTALAQVARLASSTTDYAFFFDFNRDTHFFSLTQNAAPVVTFKDNATAAATATTGFISDASFAYEWDGSSLRNDCIVQGGVYQSLRVDNFVGNGSQRAFPLTFNPNADVAPRLTINGVVATVTVETSPTAASIAGTSWVIMPNANGQYFLQTLSAAAPKSGQPIVLRYTLDGPIIARARNAAGQAALGGINHGVWQMGIQDSSLLTVGTALARGNAELQAFQYAQERISFDTVDTWRGHINAGDLITVQTHRVPDSQAAYALGFTKRFLVNQLTYKGTTTQNRQYTVSAIRVS
jgi:hypothetical protein